MIGVIPHLKYFLTKFIVFDDGFLDGLHAFIWNASWQQRHHKKTSFILPPRRNIMATSKLNFDCIYEIVCLKNFEILVDKC